MPHNAPRISFSHVGIYVAGMARMEDFYSRFMGFTVTDRGPLQTPHGVLDLVFLSRDPHEHHEIVLASGRPADLPFNVVNQISFRVDKLAGLRGLHEALAGEAVSDIMRISHGNAMSVYFRDPEGNRIELFVDMPWYVTQPLRIPFDFTCGDEELMRWAEKTARSLPGFKPVADWQRDMARRMGLA
jgi:catechol 2,3-dioxygenase-like lactoylglutathione lyase family enzyme